MSHHYKALHGTEFNYNPDLSEVFINNAKVDGEDLIEFIGHYYIGIEIAKLENVDPTFYLNAKATKS